MRHFRRPVCIVLPCLTIVFSISARVVGAVARAAEEALARGVFGAPSYIYQDELFWGQDRLEFLDRALAD